MSQFNTTELDFEKIKINLVEYFKRSGGPFRDFDFTGSGLDQLMDILAYNTHYNAVNAHMAMNESFLDSAQVRGNVVSRAKLLGYTPKSVTAPSASVRLVLNAKQNSTNSTLTLPKGTKFTTVIDEVTFTFETSEIAVAIRDNTNGTFTFNNLIIKQGATRVENYAIDNSYDQRFVINSQRVDTSTLKVEVFPTIAAVNGTEQVFSKFTEFPNVDGTSKIYFIDENADGNFEIRFGNNLFGRRPESSGLVRLTYLISDGPLANGATTFRFTEGQSGLEYEQGTAAVTTISKAAGGNDVEDIDSIKYNAPLSFISQERAVTSDDYKSIIMKNFTGLDNVSAWGGETEPIPQFGKVYISIKPTAAPFLTPLQKAEVLSLLESKKMVGITPVIVDPEYTYIYFEIFFKYDPSGTNSSAGALSSTIKQTLVNYNQTKLNNFDGVFRHSNLLAAIDNSNPAILNNVARVYSYKNVNISASSLDTASLDFGFTIDGKITQAESMIKTSTISIGGQTASLSDKPIAGDTQKRQVFASRIDEEGREVIVTPNVGFIYPATGQIDLSNLKNDVDELLRVEVRPASDDIISQRKKILQIDVERTSVKGDIDNISIAGSAGLSTYTTVSRD